MCVLRLKRHKLSLPFLKFQTLNVKASSFFLGQVSWSFFLIHSQWFLVLLSLKLKALFVAGISFSSTEETLTQAFSQYGRVLGGQSLISTAISSTFRDTASLTYLFVFFTFLVASVDVIIDKVKCRPKGFAYVTFSSNEEAAKALLELNGQVKAPFSFRVHCKYPTLLIPYLW